MNVSCVRCAWKRAKCFSTPASGMRRFRMQWLWLHTGRKLSYETGLWNTNVSSHLFISSRLLTSTEYGVKTKQNETVEKWLSSFLRWVDVARGEQSVLRSSLSLCAFATADARPSIFWDDRESYIETSHQPIKFAWGNIGHHIYMILCCKGRPFIKRDSKYSWFWNWFGRQVWRKIPCHANALADCHHQKITKCCPE